MLMRGGRGLDASGAEGVGASGVEKKVSAEKFTNRIGAQGRSISPISTFCCGGVH